MRLRRGWLGILMVGNLLGCAQPQPPTPEHGARLQVVATIFPLADIARQIGGEQVTVETLLPPGANSHTFEVSAAKARRIADADLLLRVGPGLDDWLGNLLGSSRARLVTVMEVTALLPAPLSRGPAERDEHGPADGHDHDRHDHGPNDPHVWLDPVRVRDDIAPAIAAVLSQIEPAEADGIARRLSALQVDLTALDEELAALLAPVKAGRYVAAHAAWRYFDARYELDQVAVIEATPGSDPSAGWIKSVIDTAREQQARAIFTEAQSNRTMAEVVAQDAGLKVGVLDPLGGPSLAGRDGYQALMRYNAKQFAEGLAP